MSKDSESRKPVQESNNPSSLEDSSSATIKKNKKFIIHQNYGINSRENKKRGFINDKFRGEQSVDSIDTIKKGQNPKSIFNFKFFQKTPKHSYIMGNSNSMGYFQHSVKSITPATLFNSKFISLKNSKFPQSYIHMHRPYFIVPIKSSGQKLQNNPQKSQKKRSVVRGRPLFIRKPVNLLESLDNKKVIVISKKTSLKQSSDINSRSRVNGQCLSVKRRGAFRAYSDLQNFKKIGLRPFISRDRRREGGLHFRKLRNDSFTESSSDSSSYLSC